MNSEIETKNFSGSNRQLIASHLDLTNLRWQMIVGFALALLAALACESLAPPSFMPADLPYIAWAAENPDRLDQLLRFESCCPGAPSGDPLSLLSLRVDSFLWHQDFNGYLLTNFLIRGFVMLFIALVVLELTGLSGNRSGTAGAVWAAVLFAVAPNSSFTLFSTVSRQSLFLMLFLLAGIFFWLRFSLVRERWYRHLALICLIVFVGLLAIAIVQDPIQAPNFFVSMFDLNQGQSISLPLAVAYSLSLALFVTRLAAGWLSKSGIYAAICLTLVLSFPLFCPISWPMIACSSVALSMLIPILALPIMDRIDRKRSVLVSTIGTFVLAVTFLCWCATFEEQMSLLTPFVAGESAHTNVDH